MVKQTVTRIIALGWLCWIVVDWHTVYGQVGQELLQNPGFTSYYGIGDANVVPIGWKLTSSIRVGTSQHAYIYDGPVEYPGQPSNGQAWAISANSAQFTAIGYQQVSGITPGTTLRFSVYGNVYTCDKTNSCIENNIPYRVSDQSSGAVERVGIDPTGGTNSYAATVKWSLFYAPFDHFTPISVIVTAASSQVTVFLFATQSKAMLLNEAYWYGASLQAISGGPPGIAVPTTVVVEPGVGPTSRPTVVATAVFVRTQTPQADGSIVHTVMAGDTLSSLAYAYNVSIGQIQQLNNRDPGNTLLYVGQKLLIKPSAAQSLALTRTAAAIIIVPTLAPTLTASPLAATPTAAGPRPVITLAGITATPTQSTDSVTPKPDLPSVLPTRLLMVLDITGVIFVMLYVGGILAALFIRLIR